MITKFLLQRAYMDAADSGVPPSPVQDLAEACVKFVRDALSLELDYTPETFPILDHYVRTRAAAAGPAGKPAEEIRELLGPSLGCYFGEVVRRNLAGTRWHASGDSYESYRLEFDPFFLHFNPIGVALEVLGTEDAEGFSAHFQILDEARQAVEDTLARSESVSVDDYYSFTIRYETLELVTAVLAGIETQHQERPRRFGPEVYRAAVGEPSGKGGGVS